MKDNTDRFLPLALMLLVSACAGYAFAFAARKVLRSWRAEVARQRFTVVR